MNRKILHKNKRHNLSGHPKAKIGTILGIQDKNGKWLRVGDKVKFKDFVGRILYYKWNDSYEFFYAYSDWYGDEFNIESYGRIHRIAMDNGNKMDLELIESVSH